jgi:hypothetical protein
MEVVVITHGANAASSLPDGTPVVHSKKYETRTTRVLNGQVLSPLLSQMERLVPHFKSRFTRVTGVSNDTELWLPSFAELRHCGLADREGGTSSTTSLCLWTRGHHLWSTHCTL